MCNQYLKAMASISTLTLLAACGGGGESSGGSSYSVTGQLSSSSYTIAAKDLDNSLLEQQRANAAAAGNSVVTHVWGIPLYTYDGDVFGNFRSAVEREVDENGQFSLALDDDTDWILLLMDMTASARKDQIVGYISMDDIQSDLSMVLMPVSDVNDESESLDLGTLEEVDDEAQSTIGLDTLAEELTLSVDELRELASIDDTFKSIKNHYINYDQENNRYYLLNVGFHWVIDKNLINNQSLSVAQLEFDAGLYRGYTIDVWTNVPLPLDVCDGNPAMTLNIVPPVGAPDFGHSGIDGRVYNSANPLGNDASGMTLDYHYEPDTCVDDDFGITVSPSGSEPYRFGGPWGLDYLTGAVPDGEWSIQLANTEIALFDLSSAYPFDADGNPLMYLPSPRLTVDGNNTITQVAISWFRYDQASSQYVELTDLSRLNEISNSHFLELVDYSGNDGTGERATDLNYVSGGASTLMTTFTQGAWQFDGNNSVNDLVMDEFAIGYKMSGISYRLAFRSQ